MSLGNDREQVIENIKAALRDEDYYRKVEVNDPVLTSNQARDITQNFLSSRKKPGYRAKTLLARWIANIGSSVINADTEIVGDVDRMVLNKGVIITSNHFSPMENTIIRYFVRKNGWKKLHVVSQVTNFAMKGVVGFLMNYADTIPLSTDMRYLTKEFLEVLGELMEQKQAVLIYPEQEMWYNYRKPRPLKRGAYHFAASLHRPIVSCFVEMDDTKDKIKYRLHILGVIYPDDTKSVKENSEQMCATDYGWKKAAYEKVYGKTLEYSFDTNDIAGWKPNE